MFTGVVKGVQSTNVSIE